MNKTLFLMGLVCLLSACGFSECRYGTPYIRTCAPKWGGTQWNEVQRYVIGSNITHYKAQAELEECKSRGYFGKISGTREYCMNKKGYQNMLTLETCSKKGLSREECLKWSIEVFENDLKRERFKEYRYLLIE